MTVDGAPTTEVTEVTLRPGRPDQAAALSALAVRSKGHWGYDATFLDACRDELTLAAAEAAAATVAEVRGVLAGFVLLADLAERGDPGTTGVNRDEGELAMLFVDPPFIGHGVGRLLLASAVRAAAGRGWSGLRIESDPGAEAFYLAAGATRVGRVPSGSVAGRELPLLELAVGPAAARRGPVTASSRRRRS